MVEGLVERMRMVLDAKGWTPYEWSKQSGVSDSQVANMLGRGAKRPSQKILDKLALGAGVSFDWLVHNKGPSGLDAIDGVKPYAGLEKPPSNPGVREGQAVYERSLDPKIVVQAKKRAHGLGRDPADWAWAEAERIAPSLRGEVTVAFFCDLATLFNDNNIGQRGESPRP